MPLGLIDVRLMDKGTPNRADSLESLGRPPSRTHELCCQRADPLHNLPHVPRVDVLQRCESAFAPVAQRFQPCPPPPVSISVSVPTLVNFPPGPARTYRAGR